MSISTVPRPRSSLDDFRSQTRLGVKTAKPAPVGLVLLDSTLKLIYTNSEASKIFTYPDEPTKGKTLSGKLMKVIRSIIEQQPPSENLPASTVFVSGRRRYVCRSFLLEPNSNVSSNPSIALTVERDRWAHVRRHIAFARSHFRRLNSG